MDWRRKREVIERRNLPPPAVEVRRRLDFNPVHSGSTCRAHFVCKAMPHSRHDDSVLRGAHTACPQTSQGDGVANCFSLKSCPRSGPGSADVSDTARLTYAQARPLDTPSLLSQPRSGAHRRQESASGLSSSPRLPPRLLARYFPCTSSTARGVARSVDLRHQLMWRGVHLRLGSREPGRPS